MLSKSWIFTIVYCNTVMAYTQIYCQPSACHGLDVRLLLQINSVTGNMDCGFLNMPL